MSLSLPKLICISAPSGAGKTTLCSLLLKDFKNVTLSISTTTRPRRPQEVENVHYFFVSPEEFKKKVERNEFAEWATVHGNLYGTMRKTIDEAFKAGKNVLFDIDVQGAMNLEKSYGEQALLIFIHPPSLQVLEQRLRDRKGDSPEVIEKRIRNAYNEIQWSRNFHYQITNDDLKRAYSELKQIIERECS